MHLVLPQGATAVTIALICSYFLPSSAPPIQATRSRDQPLGGVYSVDVQVSVRRMDVDGMWTRVIDVQQPISNGPHRQSNVPPVGHFPVGEIPGRSQSCANQAMPTTGSPQTTPKAYLWTGGARMTIGY